MADFNRYQSNGTATQYFYPSEASHKSYKENYTNTIYDENLHTNLFTQFDFMRRKLLKTCFNWREIASIKNENALELMIRQITSTEKNFFVNGEEGLLETLVKFFLMLNT